MSLKFVFCVLLTLLAYGSSQVDDIFDPCDDSINTRRLQRELKRHWRKWKRIRNRQDDGCYNMTMRPLCFCLPCFTEKKDVCVNENDVITNIQFNDPLVTQPGGDCEGYTIVPNYYETIDSLFQWVLDALQGNIHSITITYDPTYHFISYVYIDFSQCIADEEYGWDIEDFSFKDCDPCDDLANPIPIVAAADAAEAEWEAADPFCYCYTMETICFCYGCLEPIRVCVRFGSVDSVEYVDPSVLLPGGTCDGFPALDANDFRTIPEWFDFIRDTANDGVGALDVTYGDFGVPNVISVDRIICAIDDEITYRIEVEPFQADPDDILPELEKNYELWNETVDSTSECYRFLFERNCFCEFCFVQQYEVVVHGNEVISASFVDDTLDDVGAQCENYNIDLTTFLTVDDLFAAIVNALNNNAYSIDVTYNSDFGYPESIDIQWGNPSCIADAFIGYNVERLSFLRCPSAAG